MKKTLLVALLLVSPLAMAYDGQGPNLIDGKFFTSGVMDDAEEQLIKAGYSRPIIKGHSIFGCLGGIQRTKFRAFDENRMGWVEGVICLVDSGRVEITEY